MHHKCKLNMGRRILKSLRRSREDKPFAVQIEIDDGIPRDEATVFVSSTKEKEAAIEQKVGTVSDASEEILDQRDASPSPRQPYVPPKIWAEDFDSDSDSDNDGQKNACWHLNFGGTSKRRIQRRNEIAYAAKNQESRDEHSDGFCGIFDCDGGYHEQTNLMKEIWTFLIMMSSLSNQRTRGAHHERNDQNEKKDNLRQRQQ